MQDQQTYTPSGELQTLLADRAQQAREASMPKVPIRSAPAGSLPTKLGDGTPVQPFQDTVKPVMSFTRSQIARLSKQGRYGEFRDQILEARQLGLIQNDMGPEILRPTAEQEKAANEKALEAYLPLFVRRATEEADRLYKLYQDRKAQFEDTQKRTWAFDDHERVARQARMADAHASWQTANDELRSLKQKQLERLKRG